MLYYLKACIKHPLVICLRAMAKFIAVLHELGLGLKNWGKCNNMAQSNVPT